MYITQAEIENYLLTDINLSFEDQVEKWIQTAQNYVEKYTGRSFESVEETRLFDGNGKQEIMIDDCLEITEILDGTREVTDYKAYPANKTPKTSLYSSYGWSRGNQNYSIEGTWGYSEEAPEDIKFATVVLVAGIINGQLKEGAVKQEKIGQYSVTDTEDQEKDYQQAMDILNMYKKYTI
jgi:hypothetical protein